MRPTDGEPPAFVLVAGKALNFFSLCSIFVELSNEYRGMSSRADGGKRKVLANHLTESINTLELKVRLLVSWSLKRLSCVLGAG